MFKKSFISLIILGGLTAYYFNAWEFPRNLSSARLSSRPLLSVHSYDDIGAVRIEKKDGTFFRIARTPDGWFLTDPERDRASFALAGGIAMALVKARRIDPFYTHVDELASYELGDPSMVIDVELMNRPTERILIGMKHPLRDAYYARLAGEPEETFFLEEGLVRALDKTGYAIREKKLFLFSNSSVTRITIALFGSFTRLYLGLDQKWHLQDFPRETVDEDRLGMFLESLRNAYAKEFLDDRSADDSKWGLRNSPHSVSLLFRDGSAQTLVIGKEDKDKNAYFAHMVSAGAPPRQPRGAVRPSARPALDQTAPPVLIAKSNVHALAWVPRDFMDRRILRLNPGAVRRVEMVRGDRRDIFERRASGVWNQTGLESTPVYTQEVVSGIIDEVRTLHYETAGDQENDREQEGAKTAEMEKVVASLRFLDERENVMSELDFARQGADWFVNRRDLNKTYKVSAADLEILSLLIDSIQA